MDETSSRAEAHPSLARVLADWLPTQRWFATKGEELSDVAVDSRQPVATVDGREVEQVLLSAPTAAGTHRYQIFLGWAKELPGRLEHAAIAEIDGRWAYDALHDQALSSYLLTAIATDGSEAAGTGSIVFSKETDDPIDTTAPGLVTGAEQSNTSIVYGQQYILKVFRRLEPGPNPDAEVGRALHAAGSKHTAACLGSISGPVGGQPSTLALLSAYFAGSADGWAMATASVRDLMAEGDLRADEVGGDFADEAGRLGRAVAAVHRDLVHAFGTGELDAAARIALNAEMAAGARAVAAAVPALTKYLPAIIGVFSRATDGTQPLPTQRIHGDLHLGQALRIVSGWVIIDFEGEPAKPLAYRRSMHSPLKDIAGMLRSFDYAAHHMLAGGQPDSQHLYRATEWATRNRNAFCQGYAAASGNDPARFAELLTAFELDKAVYEVAYEHGHRPSWEPIPLQAVARLISSSETAGGTS